MKVATTDAGLEDTHAYTSMKGLEQQVPRRWFMSPSLFCARVACKNGSNGWETLLTLSLPRGDGVHIFVSSSVRIACSS